MSVAPLLTNNLDNSSKGSTAFLAQLHLPTHDLFWAKLRVQLHLHPLRSLDLLISPGTVLFIRRFQIYLPLTLFPYRTEERVTRDVTGGNSGPLHHQQSPVNGKLLDNKNYILLECGTTAAGAPAKIKVWAILESG